MQGALQEHIVLGNIFKMLCADYNGAERALWGIKSDLRWLAAAATPGRRYSGGKGAVHASWVAPPEAKTR